MRRFLLLTSLFLICLFWHSSYGACAVGSDSEQDLRNEVVRLNSWLGANSNAIAWRKYLNLNLLETQAALGYAADSMQLNEIRDRFESGADGLQHPVFRQVSFAIQRHLYSLQSRDHDVLSKIESQKQRFQSVRVEDLAEMRARAIYEINMLKRYYKTTISSRPRALLYYELRPEEMVEFLKGVDFELPPERGRDQIQAEIEAVEKKIEAIDIQIEMLNRQRNQIEDWLKRDRPELENQEPPGPDDDEPSPAPRGDGPVLQDLTDETDTALAGDGPAPVNPPQQDQLKEIESARMELLNSKEKLQQEVEELKNEVVELRASERARQKRFRSVDGELGSFVKVFKQLSLQQPDIFMARASRTVAGLKASYSNAANPNTRKTFGRRLDELAESYKALSVENDRNAAAKAGNLLGWFESAGQETGLQAAIKSRFSKPNLSLSISSRLVDELASRRQQQTQRVNENVLGRLIRGQASVDGSVKIELQPDPNQFRAAIDFSGGIDADTYTSAGKLTAYAGSRSEFYFRRDLTANIGGFFMGDVYGDVQLDSWFKGIDSRLALVQKLAQKQYCKSKYRSEEISRGRAIKKIREPFKQQTDEAIEQAYQGFENFNQQQTALGRWLPSLFLSTTSDRIFITGVRGSSFDLAATNSQAPQYDLGSDVEIRLHESMLSNYASPLVAGQTLTSKDIAELLAGFSEVSADPGESGEEQEEVSITFADARPIQFEFEGNEFGVTISGKRFTRDRQRINDAMRISLLFKIIDNSGKMQIVPAGEPKVELLDGDKNIGNVTFMSFLEGQLEKVLGKAFENEVVLPDNLVPLEILPDRMSKMAEQFRLTQLRMQQGWLYLGWSQLNEGSCMPYDAPAIWSPSQPVDEQLDTSDQLRGTDIVE